MEVGAPLQLIRLCENILEDGFDESENKNELLRSREQIECLVVLHEALAFSIVDTESVFGA